MLPRLKLPLPTNACSRCSSPPLPCSLEDLLKPELRRGPRYAALDLRRAAIVLDKYREVDKASGLAGMHKSKQAEASCTCRAARGALGTCHCRLAACPAVSKPTTHLCPFSLPLPGRCASLQRFTSRKTVDRVLKELREAESRPASRAASSNGSHGRG